MSDKKRSVVKPKPLHIVQSGEVVATLTQRRSNSGYSYTDLTLTREWVNSTSGRLAHGSSFFLSHTEDLITAIQAAAAWLRESNTAPAAKDAIGPMEDYEYESRKMEHESQVGRYSE